MKKLLLTLLFAISIFASAQELPTEPATGFAFPLGTKFTIKLHPTDSTNFEYSIIEFEPFQEIIDSWEKNKLFKEKGVDDTIEFYFCLGTHGKTEEEKKKNMQVLLVMKNRTKHALSYTSDIQTIEDGEFKETSNVGTFPNAQGTEMWPYMIQQIGLRDFKIMKR